VRFCQRRIELLNDLRTDGRIVNAAVKKPTQSLSSSRATRWVRACNSRRGRWNMEFFNEKRGTHLPHAGKGIPGDFIARGFA